jgi:hypothetical protein
MVFSLYSQFGWRSRSYSSEGIRISLIFQSFPAVVNFHQQDVFSLGKVGHILVASMLKGNGIVKAIASLSLSSFSIFTPFI